MVMAMTGDRGAGVERPGYSERDGAGSKRDRADGGDAISCARQHGPSFLGADSVMDHVLKVEIARSSAALWLCQAGGGAAPTTTVVALAPATMHAISRYWWPEEDR